MNESIPGAIYVPGREFMYIQEMPGDMFNTIADVALNPDFDPSSAMPSAGGVIEEKARATIEGGLSFIGISYKGEAEIWRRRFVGECEHFHLKYAFIKDGLFAVSSGELLPLDKVRVEFL